MKLLIGLQIMRRTLTTFMTQVVVSSGGGPGSSHAHAKTIASLSQDECVGSPPVGATNKHQASSKDSPGSPPALAKTNASEDSTCLPPSHAKTDTQDTAVVRPTPAPSKRSAQEPLENRTAPRTKKKKIESDVMYLHEINEQARDKIVGFNSEKCLPDNIKTAPVHSA